MALEFFSLTTSFVFGQGCDYPGYVANNFAKYLLNGNASGCRKRR